MVKTLTLVPAGGGCFELTVDGELIYSKLQSGQCPDVEWVLDAIRARANKKTAHG
jgi:selenoprotein W-related protein